MVTLYRRLRWRYGLKWGMRNRVTMNHIFSFIKDALIFVLAFAVLILVYGYMQQRDLKERHKVQVKLEQQSATKAMQLLQDCLNKRPLITKDDDGQVIGAIFCEASREWKL